MICDAYPDECELIRFFLALGLAMSFLSWALATLFRVAFNPDEDDEPPPLPSGSQRPRSLDHSPPSPPGGSSRASDDSSSGTTRSAKGARRRRGIKNDWEQLKELQEKRLWHEASLLLLKIVSDPKFKGEQEDIQRIIDEHIYFINKAINPMILVEIVSHLLTRMKNHEDFDRLLGSTECVVKNNMIALALCKMQRTILLLDQGEDLALVEQILEDIHHLLDLSPVTVPVEVLGKFFYLQSKYYLLKEDRQLYMEATLKYIACVDWKRLPEAQQATLANALAVSALTSDGINEIRELLLLPILDTIKDKWMTRLLLVVDSGDVEGFLSMLPVIQQTDNLAPHTEMLLRKVQMQSFISLCEQAAIKGRKVKLSSISEAAKLSVDKVDHMVMRAMSRGLVEGTLDSVEQCVNVYRVKPRPLNSVQISSIIDQMDKWDQSLGSENIKFSAIMNTHLLQSAFDQPF